MSSRERVKRNQSDLLAELSDQIEILHSHCTVFDEGVRPIGKSIAATLRVLLNNYRSSHALLHQLSLLKIQFFDSAGDLNPSNLLTENPLCIISMGTDTVYLPMLASGPYPGRWVPFEKWWNDPVIRDASRRLFSRRQLVLDVANTDGGAHVDPGLDPTYMDLSRNNSLAWTLHTQYGDSALPSPVLPCMRQIAHELLLSLKENAKKFVAVRYMS